MTAPLTLALSKGRIFEETLPLLAAAGIQVAEDPETSRKLILPTTDPNVRVIIVRATDVPTYVEYGAADFGVAGKDVLIEHGGGGLYQPIDLDIARCRMSVAVQDGFDYANAVRQGARLRVATKYVATGARALRRQGRARRPDQAVRLDGAGAAGRPGRRDRRPGQLGRHAEGEQSGRGRGDHADLVAPRREPGRAEVEARRAQADPRRVRTRVEAGRGPDRLEAPAHHRNGWSIMSIKIRKLDSSRDQGSRPTCVRCSRSRRARTKRSSARSRRSSPT